MSQLRNNKSPVDEMQKDYNRGDNFIFHVVLQYHPSYKNAYKNKNDLLALEGKAIKEYDAVNKGYNKDDTLGMMSYEHDIFLFKNIHTWNNRLYKRSWRRTFHKTMERIRRKS